MDYDYIFTSFSCEYVRGGVTDVIAARCSVDIEGDKFSDRLNRETGIDEYVFQS